MKFALDGRVAVITGGSQGLGLTIATEFVKAGASVVLCSRNNESLNQAQDILSSLTTPKQKIVSHVVDVSRREDVKTLVDKTLSLFPRVHILVNNAGIYGPKGVVEDVDWDEWMHALEINLY